MFKKGVLYWIVGNGSRKLKEPKRFFIEPKYPMVTLYNVLQKWANFKSLVQGVEWHNQTEQRTFSHWYYKDFHKYYEK